MSLSRQLTLLLGLLLALLFAGSLWLSLQHTKSYLQDGLRLRAQEAAAALGLSLSAPLNKGDLAKVKRITARLFEGGEYRQVRVTDWQGKPLVDLQRERFPEGVPGWFVTLLPLEAPAGQAQLLEGWRETGRVEVSVRTGEAYLQLWRGARDLFLLFLIATLVVLLVGMVGMRRLLRPLHQVAWQADAICRREFPLVEPLPHNRELRRLAEAMNRLAGKVRGMLAEAEELAERLRDQAYQDVVTRLANRRHFMEVLEHRVSGGGLQQGALYLIQLQDFRHYNERFGYTAGDALLQRAGELLQRVTEGRHAILLAHLTGADFVVLAEELDGTAADVLAEELMRALDALHEDSPDGGWQPVDTSHLGLALYRRGLGAGEWLSLADLALRAAQSEGPSGWQRHQGNEDETPRGATAWREFIEQALREDWLRLHRQPVLACPGRELLHEELLVRIAEDGDESRLLNAGCFLPMARQTDLAGRIDRAVIERALDLLENEAELRLAVNLSPLSLAEDSFATWLVERCRQRRDPAERLILELPEYGAVSQLERLQALQARLEGFGVGFGLDHFGRGFGAFNYLRSLKLEHLKVDGSFLRDLAARQDNQFYLQALGEIAHGLDIRVVAESVESETVWELLPALRVDAGQGWYLGPPA